MSETVKITIRHRWTDAVLLEHEVSKERHASGLAMRDAVEAAGANLAGANLADANLARANLAGNAKLVGNRPVLMIGPIGSRSAYLTAYLTDKGVRIHTGCFRGTRAEFEAAVRKEHGESVYGTEYLAALQLIDMHGELWMPEATQTAVATEPAPEAA